MELLESEGLWLLMELFEETSVESLDSSRGLLSLVVSVSF